MAPCLSLSSLGKANNFVFPSLPVEAQPAAAHFLVVNSNYENI